MTLIIYMFEFIYFLVDLGDSSKIDKLIVHKQYNINYIIFRLTLYKIQKNEIISMKNEILIYGFHGQMPS